jgi:hypothetical protein
MNVLYMRKKIVVIIHVIIMVSITDKPNAQMELMVLPFWDNVIYN